MDEKLAEFNRLVEKEIRPMLKKYEPLRKKEFFKYQVWMFINISILVSFGLFLRAYIVDYYLKDTSIAFLLFLFVPPILFFSWKYYIKSFEYKNKKFCLHIKHNLLQEILKIFKTDIKWSNLYDGEDVTLESVIDDIFTHYHSTYITTNSLFKNDGLYSSGLFMSFTDRLTDDSFKGTYKEIPFSISETRLYISSLISNNWTNPPKIFTVFKGIVIDFKFNKTIKNRTIISSKRNITVKNTIFMATIAAIIAIAFITIFSKSEILGDDFGWIYITMFWVIIPFLIFLVLWFIFKKEPLNKVNLEDVNFSKKFNVYSSDQVEARYLVTPGFMERFYNLKTAFKSDKIKCSFYDKDKFMIAISTNKDLFEFGDLSHSLLKTKSYIDCYNQIKSIIDMIDYFKLDQKTGL